MAIPETQTALIQTGVPPSGSTLGLKISNTVQIPELTRPNQVLIRVLAVALNPTDHKMVTHFPVPGNQSGCDFCGIIEKIASGSTETTFPPGTRVSGGTFPYSRTEAESGAFAQWIAVDSQLLLKVPDNMSDLEGAALGGVGWGTAGLAFYDSEALALDGTPSNPTSTNEPILVYGGATATGTMACQLLKLSGYAPIAVTSTSSASLALKYGAVGTAIYTSPNCVQSIKEIAGGKPVKKVLDCITSEESAAHSFAAIARTGGRYAYLEGFNEAFRTRQTIRTKEVMGYEGLGVKIDLGPTPYSREANQTLFDVTARVAAEMQKLVDAGLIKTHPVKEVPGKWEGIIKGLEMLHRGEVRGQKLVVRISS
ncbi:putative secondary metabolism biosynthetic enzyme [Exserohilum turcicum]